MSSITLKYWYDEKIETIEINRDTSINHRLVKDFGKNYLKYIESELNNDKEFIVISNKSFWRMINKRNIYELYLHKEPIDVFI